MTSEEKGIIALCKAEIRASELGFITSRPSYPARYDLIVDEGSTLHRVQVKYADGIGTHSSASVRLGLIRRGRVYTTDEIDYVLVYVPTIDKVLKLPSEVWNGKSSLHLRVRAAKNNQQVGAIVASDLIW